MKKLSALMAWFSMIFGVQAQETRYNDSNAEVREITGFTGIKVATGIELVLTQSTTEAVAVSAATAEYRSRIKTVVKGGILDIYYVRSLKDMLRLKSKGYNLKVYVSAITLNSINVSSGATAKIEGSIKAGNIVVNISSGGQLNGAINATTMKVTQGSGSLATMSGNAETFTIKVNSGASFTGYDFVVNNCDARVSSGGSVEITVNSELNAKASSGGSVNYKGSCKVTKRTNSGGSVSGK